MRTTIRIDDDLYRRAKASVARRGQTVGELIEDAVRLVLRPRNTAVAEIPSSRSTADRARCPASTSATPGRYAT